MAEIDSGPPPRNGRHGAEEWLLGLVQKMVISILDERDRRYQDRWSAQQDALKKVEDATEKRFESVNEFRKAMSDRDILYMPRAEYISGHQALSDKIDSHSREDVVTHDGIAKRIEAQGKRIDNFEGAMKGSRNMLTGIAGGAAFLVALIVIGTWVFTGKSVAPAAQVIYVPAPVGTQLPVTPPAQVPR